MIDGQSVFSQTIKNILRTYDSIRKIGTDQGDDYATSCFLDYNHLKNHHNMIAKT